jgi:Zn-dependent protease
MDFFGAGIPLGKWFRIQVILHWTFVLYVVMQFVGDVDRVGVAIWLGVLFGTVLVHEFGHALTCRWVGGEAIQIVLWPLGGLAFVQPPPRPWPSLWTTIGGPITHIPMAALWFCIARFVVPHLPPTPMEYVWLAAQYGMTINVMLLIFNLIPAYPMDGGRILQELLWMVLGYPRSLQIAGMVGTVAGAAFVGLGLGVLSVSIPWVGLNSLGFFYRPLELGGESGKSTQLVVIGILAAMESFRIYRQSQEIDSRRKR